MSLKRTESAVQDNEPITMMNNTPTIKGDKYVAAICGIKLLLSPSSCVMPAIATGKPRPKPITMEPYPMVAVIKVGLTRSSRAANKRWADGATQQ